MEKQFQPRKHKGRINIYFLISILFIVISCGDSNESLVPEELRGTWTSGCQEDDFLNSSSKVTWVNSETIMHQSVVVYDSTGCVGNVIQESGVEGPYTYVKTTTTAEGIDAITIQFPSSSIDRVIYVTYALISDFLYFGSPYGIGLSEPFFKISG